MSLTAPDLTPATPRRTGATSARGLLFTVLGELVLPSGGCAWTSTFIEMLGLLGIEEKASRQALMRTAADGWLESKRMGRRTLWRLSPAAERLLTEGTERIYGFHGAQREWDGRWLLVLARVPESDRPARHILRTRLTWAGFGSPAPSVWISTHADRTAEAERVLDEAGILGDAQIFSARHRGGRLETMVRQAWDLDAIERSYEEFMAAFARQPSRDPLVRIIELVHAWRAFPRRDPELPTELLPDGWSGARAAELFHRQHTKWTGDATAAWQRITTAADA